ncbi:rhomboid family intramembrane serine protease [Paracoccus sp. S-4012]|uniref:rhomboid family intramembrane serine protease n=1 Tax=Paracoccus sp. S-4012 TaxID=2665648 RepID=UPI0012AFC2EE|nr:rhomboid family intramembrane serine protease [Paracoccus sp. S-4012]MRX49639.1 rhomboid family intramembrane serine protease [Paracoccus sp. S-4012]
MHHGYDESPFNPLPLVVWALVLPAVASEAVFALNSAGFTGGGIGLRGRALELAAYPPEMALRMWQWGVMVWDQSYRILSYPFIHYGFTHAAFVVVFTLALGKVLSETFRPVGVLGLWFGCTIGAALIYTTIAALLPGIRFAPLVGGFPPVYGFVGAFTFLLWARLGQIGGNRMRAFSLIGMLLLFQLTFGLIFGGAGTSWIAEIAGFCLGFGLSFVLVPGGPARVRRALRQR